MQSSNMCSAEITNRTTSLLQELVRIESISGNEKNISDTIYDYIKKLDIKNLSINRFGNSILAEYKVDTQKKTLGLISHIDTVDFTFSNWSENPLGGAIKNGRMYGRGTTDVKQGSAILLSLLHELDSHDPSFNLKMVFYDKEELCIPNGLTDVLNEGVLDDVDFSLVFEPTDNEINYGCFGCMDIKIDVLGKATHSSMPNNGINAVSELGKLIDYVATMERLKLNTKFHQEVEEAISITQVNTNNAPNIIPGICGAHINYRFSPELAEEEAKSKIISTINKSGLDINLKAINIDPSYISENIPPEIEKLSKDIRWRLTVVPFWSDIAQIGNRGIPSFNIGASTIKLAHVDDEYIDLSELNKFTSIMHNFIFSDNK